MEEPPKMETVGAIAWCGGYVDRTSASLRFSHDDLDPDIITDLLGCEPSRAQRKGDLIPGHRKQRVAYTGSWSLRTPIGDMQPLDGKLNWLLDQVSTDLSAWDRLSHFKFNRMDMFCYLQLKEWNRGFSLPADLLRRLGERHLQVEFDIYCDTNEEAPAV